MGLRTFFTRFLDSGEKDTYELTCAEWSQAANNAYIRELAFYTGVRLISWMFAGAEFKTYEGEAEVRKQLWDLFNHEPNVNHNAFEFKRKMIEQLYYKNEVLIVMLGDQIHIADSFDSNRNAIQFPWTYKDIYVNNYKLDGRFLEPDIVHLTLDDRKVKRILDRAHDASERAINAYDAMLEAQGGVRGILKIPGVAAGQADRRKIEDEKVVERFKAFSNRNAIVPLNAYYDYTDLSDKIPKINPSDRTEITNRVYSETAQALGVPAVLLKGETAGVADVIRWFITSTIKPLAGLVESEFNRKFYKADERSKGNRIRVDLTKLQHIELLDSAAPIEKIVGSGFMTINELRRETGYPASDDPACDKHFITKNFGTTEDITNEK